MSPAKSSPDAHARCFPRVSGDEPMDQLREAAIQAFSPRERG